MASPQLENGYTPIANEILDKIACLPLNGTQFRIVTVVWRYTYGFSRKEHDLSETFIANATGIHRKQIQREINTLIKFSILFIMREATFKSSRIIAFNKDYDSWQVTKKLPGSEKEAGNKLAVSPGSELATQDNQDLKTKDLVVVDENKTPLSPQSQNENDFGLVPKAWETNFKLTMPGGAVKSLKAWNEQDSMPAVVIAKAIEIAAGEGKRSLSYIEGILHNWADAGVKTIAQVELFQKEWKQRSRDKPDTRSGTLQNNKKVVNIHGGAGTSRGDPAGDPIPISSLIVK
jgi:phage replication O-like protein O